MIAQCIELFLKIRKLFTITAFLVQKSHSITSEESEATEQEETTEKITDDEYKSNKLFYAYNVVLSTVVILTCVASVNNHLHNKVRHEELKNQENRHLQALNDIHETQLRIIECIGHNAMVIKHHKPNDAKVLTTSVDPAQHSLPTFTTLEEYEKYVDEHKKHMKSATDQNTKTKDSITQLADNKIQPRKKILGFF